MNLPILGISMGDPFGNGPEITVKALADRSVYDRCRPLVVGDMASMEYAVKVAEKVSGIHLELRPVRSVAEARFQYGTIDVYDMGLIKAGRHPLRCRRSQALWPGRHRPGRRGLLPVCSQGH